MVEKALTAAVREVYVCARPPTWRRRWGREVCAEIDDKVKAFLARPIEGDWPHLWILRLWLAVALARLASSEHRSRCLSATSHILKARRHPTSSVALFHLTSGGDLQPP
jgi:hypothetical protein